MRRHGWPDRLFDSPARGRAITFGGMKPSRRPADIASRSAQALARRSRTRDAFRRETFALPRDAAREKAREMFRRFPKAAYMTEVESWRVLPGDRIEFMMRWLPSAD